MSRNSVGAAIRIILVEDFHAETEIVLRELKESELWFEHKTANSEDSFRELLKTYNPDVILSPYSLSKTNALKLFKIAREGHFEVPFILLAFDLSEDIAIDLLAEGIEDYVQRSTLKRLSVAIRKALSRHKTQLELMISEARLRSSEESLREAQKVAKIGSWEWEISKEEVHFSDEMYRIYGTEPRPLTIESVKGFIHPDDRDWIGKYLVKGLTEGYEEIVDYRIVTDLGATKYVRSHTEVIKNPEGQIIKLFGTLQDITERKKIELELRNSQGLLAIGEEVSNSGSFELDLNQRTTRWSKNLYKITGLDPSKPINHKRFVSHIHPEDRATYTETLRKSIKSSKGNPFVYRFIRPDNDQLVYLQANGRPVEENGNVIKWIGSVQDISDRILTQMDLERAHANLSEVQGIAGMGSWEWEIGSEDVWWSEEMYKIYEFNRPPQLTDVFDFMHPDDFADPNIPTCHEIDGVFIPSLDYRMLLPSGKIKHVISRAKQVKDHTGKPVRLLGMLQDVTQQVEAERKHEAERIQQELTVHAAQIGIWHWAIDKNEISWDKRCFEIYEIQEQTITPQDFLEFIHPDDVDTVQERISEAFASGSYTAEYRIKTDGSIKYLHARGKVTYNKAGSPERLDGVILDMTERHEMEMALRENELLFRDMAESITEVFWLTDWNLNEVLYVSPQYETLYGLSRQSLYENPGSWTEAIHPDDQERASSQFRKLALTGEYDEEYRLVMKDGTIKWVRDRAFPVKNADGSTSRIAGITEEITKQKQDQHRIETLSLVASETINGVLIHEADGTVAWANKGFTQITGYSESEILGKEPWSVVAGKDTDKSLIDQTYEYLKAGKPFASDNKLVHKDGHSVWVNTAFTPIMGENGEIVKVVSIGTDITKQKEQEALQSSMLKQLESQFQDRTEELEKTNQELKDEIWEKQRLSDELYHSNLDLRESILYAKRIQDSILPTDKRMRESFSDLFVLYKPRDVVSGDFYWHFKRDNLSYFATIDCTGHGVPGALMSMIANELMNQVIIQHKLNDPSEILQMLNKLMIRSLRQKEDFNMRDGMDMSLCVINHETNKLSFAGALGNMYLHHNGKVTMFSGSRHSVGGHLEDVKKVFETKEVTISSGDTIYMKSDGYIDQFGGPDGKKFMKKRFAALLTSIHGLPLSKQKQKLESTFADWKGPLDQVDDVLVVGLRY